MTKNQQARILHLLSCINTDVDLFIHGDWEPDQSSMEAIGDVADKILETLQDAEVIPKSVGFYDVINGFNPLELGEIA